MWRDGSPRGRIAAGVLVALLLLSVGFTAGLLSGRGSSPGEDSAEVGFARDMSTHHAQAVEMGMIAYQKASLEEVRIIGGDIAITQQGQIGTMQGWLDQWGVNRNGSGPPMAWMPNGEKALNGNLMPGMATREEIAQLKAASGKDLDIMFLQFMLRHHLGGIHMVDGVLADGPSPEVRTFAETIKNNQSREVNDMQQLLNRLGAKPLGS